MGFTPLQGLVMGTRCGDIDAELVVYLQKNTGLSPDHVVQLLNKESGLKGVCGDSDMRKVLERAKAKDTQAMLALEMFINRLVFYIGGYTAEMEGIDAIIFTGGIGEHAASIRARVCESLRHLGVKVDSAKNKRADGTQNAIISSTSSKVKVLVIPTHEELVIAREVVRLVK
jgi:acetate kinase